MRKIPSENGAANTLDDKINPNFIDKKKLQQIAFQNYPI